MSGGRATAFQVRMMSIRKNLLLWLLTGLLVAGFFAGIATFMKTQEEVGEMFDYQLQQIALSMKYSARTIASQFENMGEGSNEDNDFMVQVWDAKGALLYSSLPSVKLPRVSKPGFADVDVPDGRWRIYSLVSGNRIIQAAQPATSRAEASLDMALRMLLPLFVLIPALALLAWVAVKRSLLPMTNVTSEVERRDVNAMTQLATDSVPNEIRPLLLALNSLLQRLDSSIASQRRFVADAAHELRTPLTALSLQADLVEQAENPIERTEAIDDLRKGIARASHLVSQLLTLARQEPDVQRQFTSLDLGSLVRQMASNFFPIANSKHINLQVQADQKVVIMGDEDGLRTVISNLIDNAIHYTRDAGEITVSVTRETDSAMLTVSDTGPGIPEEDRQRIFERFYRIQANGVTGSGLGLSIVKQILQRHGASISVEAGDGGKGSQFVVRFYFLSARPAPG
jgi:two-component system, OmpR family, sensor kinase